MGHLKGILGKNRTARTSVLQDWAAALPREKRQLFEGIVRRWELPYAMMSVALDDALSLRTCGKLACARQQAAIAAELVERFADLMISSCDTLAHRGRNAANLPQVEPLKAEFFRGKIAQFAASWCGLMHNILPSDRSRFLNKLKILSGTVERLRREFRHAAQAIHSTSPSISEAWSTLDCSHYDFNTCLREAEVVLKSFLRALSAEDAAILASLFHLAPPPEPALRQPALSFASDVSPTS